MKYAILIYSDEADWAAMEKAEMDAMYAEYGAYSDALAKAGILRGGWELQPTSTATTVRVRGGKVLTTDGPFAETKEQFGGFYVIEVPDLDSALAWAAKVPSARVGSIEVRPLGMGA